MCAWLTSSRRCCCGGGHLRVDLLLGRALARKLGALAKGQNVHADLHAGHPVVAARAGKGGSVFFPVSIGAHARAEVGLCRSHGRRLRRLRLPQRHQIRPRLFGRRHLLFQRALRKCVRLNRLQFGCLQFRVRPSPRATGPTPVPGRPAPQSTPLCARPHSPQPTCGPTPPQGRP